MAAQKLSLARGWRQVACRVGFCCALALSLMVSRAGLAAQTASVRMFCLSVKVGHGSGYFGLYSMDFTSINGGINGELVPVSGASRNHASGLLFYDETLFDEPVPGTIYLDVPAVPDSNGDGFNDFFDVSRGVNASSQGSYTLPGYTSGSVSASWTRAAGSKSGTCVLTLQSGFGSLGDFTHPFEILEYQGSLAYVPDIGSVTGKVSMAQTEAPENVLNGTFVFQKEKANPTDWLTLLAGNLTNSDSQVLPFYENPYTRDPVWPTNYFGYVIFPDGDLSTPEADYDRWVLSIDDLNDSDGDGIPDFSDTPSTVIRQPVLQLSVDGSALALRIGGDVGSIWELQETTALGAAWSVVSTITLTNDPQKVTLGLPSGNRFWRLIKQ